uniref:Uncharacterized protein n=1 Tax=Anguilla anguilla TaxID=7936 RepID=A0A0E9S4X9_ANGAN
MQLHCSITFVNTRLICVGYPEKALNSPHGHRAPPYTKRHTCLHRSYSDVRCAQRL